MKAWYSYIVFLLLLAYPHISPAQKIFDTNIKPADANPKNYLPLLKKKRVALVINQTSKVGSESLLDAMLRQKVDVKKIFVPEHGFRGREDAGAHIENT